MRRPLIAGNWKMHFTVPEGLEYALQLRRDLESFAPLVDLVILPPALMLWEIGNALRGCPIEVGAQNASWEDQGPYTGEISPRMLAGWCQYLLIGHSERRQYFGETDDTVNLRLKTALEAGFTPICCVGEVLEEREAGMTDDVLRRQCVRAFHAISAKKAAKLVVAYEPVWAIGTGKTATPEIAAEAHAVIRKEATGIFGEEFANNLRILYGGSVKPENVSSLMAQEEIDGALVGGASLDAKSFTAIVKY